MRQVLEKAKDHNLKLNKDKCKIGLTEIKYIGHILTKDGMKPDPDKIEAVTQLPKPESRKDLERFLGMIQYLGKFLPDLSQESAPPRVLLRKEIEWHWDTEQEQCFQRLKELATKAPVLRYFDIDKPVKISVDASQKGLGAVLLQEEHPVAYASRSLTPTQQGYAQIEKEMLAIVYGCEKFHQYIYGKEVLVESDHKPLEAIVRKPLVSAPPRIQRLLMRAQRYNLKVEYKPGKEMYIADTLSRAYLEVDQTHDEFDKRN
ncbi:hypothetical protein BSL78_14743 [Apostichopus japonicus]|uniref:Reverse transcriptase/retrotransposon-derived protein RNase H-like domain-containing protein n=1 Tax=Stichopus japonicus TaxID=307972 RepID=A0A2G8KK57_STIJA|nr:hypothetical protein BSL78_14743 [Apostichopus japonicus]